MFKKKTTLPARPSMLSKEEIIEDLSHAPSDDVVFKSDLDEMKNSSEILDDFILKNDSKFKNSNEAYLMVSSFVEKMSLVQNHLSELQKKKESLQNLEESLLSDMIKIEEELKKCSET